MWTCPICNLEFANANQVHSCGDKSLDDFLNGKSPHTVGLFYNFVDQYRKIGEITIHPTKSMISIAARTRFAYIIQLGKNFIDVVFPFKQPFEDNLCFNKIKQVPGSGDYNHHLRLYFNEDINEEVLKHMKLAYENSLNKS